MVKESLLYFLITLMLLAVSLVFRILPEGPAAIVTMFSVPLFSSFLLGILAGPFHAGAYGILYPMLSVLLFRDTLFPDALVVLLTLLGSGIFVGILYGSFHRVLLTDLFGLLSAAFLFALFSVILHAVDRSGYTFRDYSAFLLHRLPAAAAILILQPIIVAILRKTGIMFVLRDEQPARRKQRSPFPGN